METRQSRRLGSFERAEALTAESFAFNVVVVIRLAGVLTHGRLRRALDEVQRRYPLLRSRITGLGRRKRFEVGEFGELNAPALIALRDVERPTDDTWQRVVEEELSSKLDAAASPLARAARLGGDDGSACEVVLTFHHAIVDGVSLMHLVQQILDLCSSRDVERLPERSLPASADALFPARYRAPRRWPASLRFLAAQAVDEIAFRWRAGKRPRPVIDRSRGCRVLSLALSEEQSTALVRAARRRRVGLYSVLSAAMLLAVAGRRHGNRAAPHRYFAFPLLRSYLSPPVAADVVAGYLTTMRLTLPLEPEEGLWHAAKQIHQQVDRAVKRGERFLASRWSAASMAMLLRQRTRMGTTALNYAGAAQLQADANAPFSIQGLHAFVTNFPLGPEYTGQSRIFERRLWWDIVYLDADMDRGEATAIAEAMRDLVVEAAGQASSESM